MAKKKQHNSSLRPLGSFFRRFHFTLFFVFITACVAGAVILVDQTLNSSETDGYASPINAGTIDQATLERVQSLHPSTEPSVAPSLPGGRINPFAE